LSCKPERHARTDVLLTCAGRRNYLVEFFRAALAGSGRVLAADARADAAALAEADAAFVTPDALDPHYPERLLELCAREDVGLVVPLNDLELPVLARERERFRAEGVQVVVSSPEVIDLCFDKLATARKLAEWGFAAPATFDELGAALHALDTGRLLPPAVVKPRWGSGSIGVEFCQDRRELVLAHQLVSMRLGRTALAASSAADPEHAVLVQEHVPGQEYGLDIVNDLAGRTAAVFVKRKLAMRAGETDRAETVADADLEQLGHDLGTRLGHVGNLDCDLFVHRQGVTVMELNPRFGGGYPFTHAAGANVPAALVAWWQGRAPEPGWLEARPGVVAAKCDRLAVHRSH